MSSHALLVTYYQLAFYSMNETKTFDVACTDLCAEIATLIASAKGLIIRAQAESPLSVPDGLTLDEQQAEVTADVELALRHLEDASTRLATAGVSFGTAPVAASSSDEASA